MSQKDKNIEYKNPPSHYPDWNVFNEPHGQKQPGRFHSDILVCKNESCSSHGKAISERESFYLFAKQPIWKRIASLANLYICPFCGGKDLEPPFGMNARV